MRTSPRRTFPRGTELMRKVGVEPEMRVVDVLDLG